MVLSSSPKEVSFRCEESVNSCDLPSQQKPKLAPGTAQKGQVEVHTQYTGSRGTGPGLEFWLLGTGNSRK